MLIALRDAFHTFQSMQPAKYKGIWVEKFLKCFMAIEKVILKTP
jgi:hypothetical protein